MRARAGSTRPGSFAYSDALKIPAIMTTAVAILPAQQLAALNDAYRKAVARKRLRVALGAAVFCRRCS